MEEKPIGAHFENSPASLKIAVLGSHSALQILKGAKDEGFETLVLAEGKNARLYRRFDLADEVIELADYSEIPSLDQKLVRENAVLVPHGSLISHANIERLDAMKCKYYGNKKILEWELDRSKQKQWIEKAGLNAPREFKHAREIDSQAIVKYDGARGGKGYFLAGSESEYEAGKAKFGNAKHVIQQYVLGVPFYIHYFQSILTGELEIMSMDRRYETNADALGRIPLERQKQMKAEPSFTVVGNSPLVLRESMLETAFEMGEKLVEASRSLAGARGLFGPFCIESIITPEQEFFVVEVSARIVAGTNLFVQGSPYTALKYGFPVSTGRRVAMEIRRAVKENRLEEVLS